MKTAALTFPLLASAMNGASALLRHGADGVNNMEIVSTEPIARELDWDYEVARPEEAVDTQVLDAEEEVSIPREREMLSCSNGEELVNISFDTDKFGSETSWILFKGNNQVAKSNTGAYKGNSSYDESYCLKSGKDYTLQVNDAHGDGMCCSQGSGSFKVKVRKSNGGWKTLAKGGEFAKSVTEVFTVPTFSSSSNANFSNNSSNNNSSNNGSSGSNNSLAGFTSRMGCPSGQRKVKMEMKVDMYGKDDKTSWVLKDKSNGSKLMESKDGGLFAANEYESKEMCLSAGQYEIVLSDAVGDGVCCNFGNGYYTFSMEDNGVWDEIISGGNFKSKTKSEFIFVGSSHMSSRDEEWLVAHNSRREYWHKSVYGKSFIPLKWSSGLAASAQKYAEDLLDSCDSSTIIHDPKNSYGENMAKNKGTGGWGELKPADNIVGRFVDREVGLDWPQNAHLTQALWRASKYVGCGDAVKDHNGGKCRIQVCRYSKPGNCGINNNTWESKMLEDDSGCEPACPPEGCF
mmetsp:Transcript_11325/g.23885  ORF Transcript_11325/g.23885 Transcript_11325/m.23885 type:complete len:517 (+) Transcript_11325:140-1690(+)